MCINTDVRAEAQWQTALGTKSCLLLKGDGEPSVRLWSKRLKLMKDQVRSPKLIPVIHSHKLPCFKEPVMHFFPVLISPTQSWPCFPQESHRDCTLAVPKERHVGIKNIRDVYALVSTFPMA